MRRKGQRNSHLLNAFYTLVIVQILLLTLSFGLGIVHMLQMTGSGKFSTLFKVTQLICDRAFLTLPQVMPSQETFLFTLPHGGYF